MRHPCATIADGLEALKRATELELAEETVEEPVGLPSNELANRLGWIDAKRDTIARLQMWIDHLRLVAIQRFPWCDTCKLPAVSSESLGRLHSVPGNRFGLHPELDKSGHEVTIKEWFDVSSSDLTA